MPSGWHRECCHTASYYYIGKDPIFAFDTAVPFGMNNRQMDAWYRVGNGMKLMREFFGTHGLVNFPAAIPGCRWAAGSARKSRQP